MYHQYQDSAQMTTKREVKEINPKSKVKTVIEILLGTFNTNTLTPLQHLSLHSYAEKSYVFSHVSLEMKVTSTIIRFQGAGECINVRLHGEWLTWWLLTNQNSANGVFINRVGDCGFGGWGVDIVTWLNTFYKFPSYVSDDTPDL